LEKLCKRLECVLEVSELVFFGLRVSKDRVAPGEDKAKAIKKAGPRSSISELSGGDLLQHTHSEPGGQIRTVEESNEERWRVRMGKRASGRKGKVKDILVTKALGYFNVD
jgi:hypothetical protein